MSLHCLPAAILRSIIYQQSIFFGGAGVLLSSAPRAIVRCRPENLPYIESSPCNMLAKIFLVPLSIPIWMLGACIWITLQLFRLMASPCL